MFYAFKSLRNFKIPGENFVSWEIQDEVCYFAQDQIWLKKNTLLLLRFNFWRAHFPRVISAENDLAGQLLLLHLAARRHRAERHHRNGELEFFTRATNYGPHHHQLIKRTVILSLALWARAKCRLFILPLSLTHAVYMLVLFFSGCVTGLWLNDSHYPRWRAKTDSECDAGYLN